MNLLAVFLAAVGPMLTVPALRRLLVEQHGAGVPALHAFVAVGMVGAAIGAPALAARADARGSHARTAVGLALVDAVVTLLTSLQLPTAALFALRPIHGAASMGLLALLISQYRGSTRRLLAHAGVAMVAALAIGPAVGGGLVRLGPSAPFRVASVLALGVAAIVARVGLRGAERTAARAPLPAGALRALAAPLAMTLLQRFAIGGFVVAFAVRAHAAGFADATIGACFSLLLVVFALAMTPIARLREARHLAGSLPLGGVLFGVALVVLAFAPRWGVYAGLALAGLGAAMVYAPSLAFAARLAPEGRSATTLALLHAAGAIGMVLGPVAAAVVDVLLRHEAAASRAGVFLAVAGALQVVTAIGLTPRFRALAALGPLHLHTSRGTT